MDDYGGDLLRFQVSSYELPVQTGVFGAIDLLVCQGKEDIGISRADEQFLDGMTVEIGDIERPRLSPVV